jgi:hypothetical protein
MKAILALATLLAAVSAQTGELVWCEDTMHYLNREGVVLDTFDGIVSDIEACKHLCDTDENGCNFVWFHEAERGLGTECKLIRDTYKWKPRSFRNRGYTYNGRLCMENDHKIPCEENADCYVALHECNPELRHCEDRPTPEPTEATEEPTEATVEPSEATAEPTEATEEPTLATEEPTEATEEPTEATDEPTEATEEPSEATEEPTEATEEPTLATEEPTEATEEPTEATEEPSEATAEPTEATDEPTEATAEPTEVTAEPTDATDEPTVTPEQKWCAKSENYLNHKGKAVQTSTTPNVEECMAGCDAFEGCNMVWFYQDNNKCRYFEGAHKLKAKSRTDTRVHITYAGRLCSEEGEMMHCTEDYHCYYMDHCDKESGNCVDGAPVEPESLSMKVLDSPVAEIGKIQLLLAAIGVAAVLYGSFAALKKFGRGNYTPVPAAIESEEV